MAEVYHALGLHMHQPLGNLVALHNSGERWEARQILWCYDRVTRMLEGYAEVVRMHVSFSGTLLKQLEDGGLGRRLGTWWIFRISLIVIAIRTSSFWAAGFITRFIR